LAEIAKRDERIAYLEQHLRLMEQKVDGLVRRLFGTSNEKLDPAQLQLLLLELPGAAEGKAGASSLQEADPPKAAVSKPRRARHERWPQDLPVVEEVLEPAEVQAAPEHYRLIGAEVSEQLDYEPARFLLRRLIRRKYVHRQKRQQPPFLSPLPETLQERCMAAPGLLAAVIVGKYVDHLPLHRQEDIFRRRHQVQLPRASLARWVGVAADWLRPIYELIRTQVMAEGYVQVDETPIRYLDPGGGKTKLGYLWTTHAPGGDTFYHWETSRAAACLTNVLSADFRGKVQCDGYAAYPSFARDKQHLRTGRLLGPCAPALLRGAATRAAAGHLDPAPDRPPLSLGTTAAGLRRRPRTAGRAPRQPSRAHLGAPAPRAPRVENLRGPFASQFHGTSHRLRLWPVGSARRLPPRRPSGNRHQPSGTGAQRR
jgi:transposase